MEKVTVALTNMTQFSIVLCGANVGAENWQHDETRQIDLYESWISGHSSNGSFAIRKNGEDVRIMQWGTFSLTKKELNGEITVDVRSRS